MTMELYREYATLVIHRNFSSAAKALHISQPTLSRHMIALEKEMKQELFFSTQPLTLTFAGKIVLRYATEFLDLYSSLQNELTSTSKVLAEHIRIQDLLHIEALFYEIAKASEITKERYPNACFSYVTPPSGLTPFEMIEKKYTDIAFLFTMNKTPYKIAEEIPDGIEAIPIPRFHGTLCFGVDKNSALAERDDLKLADFSKTCFYFPARRYYDSFKEAFVAICKESGFTPRFELIPVNNPLEFYNQRACDNVYVLNKLDIKAHTLIQSSLQDKVKFVSLTDTKIYVDAFALYDIDNVSSALEDFTENLLECVERSSISKYCQKQMTG